MAFIDGITDEHVSSVITVGDSIGEIATSLYGYLRLNSLVIPSVNPSVNPSVKVYDYLSLNPSVIPSVKSSEKIVRRRYGRYIPTKYFCWYIPTVSPTDVFRRYIPTDFEMEFSPSVITTNGIFPSVIPLVFSGFLVVISAF
jgi:hypothetical protein